MSDEAAMPGLRHAESSSCSSVHGPPRGQQRRGQRRVLGRSARRGRRRHAGAQPRRPRQTPGRAGRTVIEPDLVYPLLRWSDVRRLGRCPGPRPTGPGSCHASRHRRGRDARALPAHAGYLERFRELLSARAAYRRYQAQGRSIRCTTWAPTRWRRSRWCGGGWTGGSTRRWSKPVDDPLLGRRPADSAGDVRAGGVPIGRRGPLHLRGAQQRGGQRAGFGLQRAGRQRIRHARHVGLRPAGAIRSGQSAARCLGDLEPPAHAAIGSTGGCGQSPACAGRNRARDRSVGGRVLLRAIEPFESRQLPYDWKTAHRGRHAARAGRPRAGDVPTGRSATTC